MGYQEFGKLGNIISQREFTSFYNLRGGTLTAAELIIAGGTHGVIRSQNYDGSSAGWAIFGDGSASFYGDITIGASAIIQGDLYSSNWNGTIPANLSSVDAGATAGYYLDSSVGAAQFEGDVYLGGDIVLESGGAIKTSSGTDYVELTGTSNQRLSFYDGGSSVGFLGYNTSGASLDLQADNGNLYLRAGISGSTHYDVVLAPDSTAMPANHGQVLLNQDGTAAKPAFAFVNDTDTGLYRFSANAIGFAIAGARAAVLYSNKYLYGSGTTGTWVLANTAGDASNPTYTFDADTGTGMYRVSASKLGLTTGGGNRLYLDSNEAEFSVDVEIVHSGGPKITLHDAGNVWFKLQAGATGSYMTLGSNVRDLFRFHPSVSKILAVEQSSRPQYSHYSDQDTGIGLAANNYIEFWGGNTVMAYFGSNDFRLASCGTTTNSGLPAYRSGASTTEHIHRLTSSARYKKFISRSDFDELEPIFDKIEVKRWKEKASEVPHPSKDWIHGVIAEEVNEYAPQYVAKEEDGTPSAVDPANAFIIPTIAKVKRLEKRISEQDARIAALEAALN